MIIDGEQDSRAEVMPLEIMWRNPLCLVLAQLRLREASSLYYGYYGWAGQARKIRARRANWDANHNWQHEQHRLSTNPVFLLKVGFVPSRVGVTLNMQICPAITDFEGGGQWPYISSLESLGLSDHL
jgi:hypothetical protein